LEGKPSSAIITSLEAFVAQFVFLGGGHTEEKASMKCLKEDYCRLQEPNPHPLVWVSTEHDLAA